MLLFRSEEMLEQWCRGKGLARGEVLTPDQIWELSNLWYHNRLSLEYHGRNAEQAREIFNQAGLRSKFWQTNG
jgi:hypothetical protein